MSEFIYDMGKVDVICQHRRDGKIIPLRVRICDEDGVFQVFAIKAYKEISHPGDYTMPSDIPANSHIWRFECKIMVFNVEKRIKLFYNAYDNLWKLDYLD